MNCPQCNAELPESATFCHSCGSPVHPATFSYLPPGTPAWPTTIPQKPVASVGATAQTVQQKDNESISSTKPLPARPKRSARTILTITSLFILITLVGIAATLGMLWFNGEIPVKSANTSLSVPSPSTPQSPGASNASTSTAQAQTNQLPTPSSFQTATINEVGVTLKYPKEWIKDASQTTTSSVVLAFHPQQKNGIDLFLERFTSATSAKLTSANDVNQNNLSSFQNAQGITNFHAITPSSTQISVGGAQWDEQDATFSTTQGLVFHLTSIAVQHNQLYYDILFYAPSVVYNEAVQKYFQPMLSSLQFKS